MYVNQTGLGQAQMFRRIGNKFPVRVIVRARGMGQSPGAFTNPYTFNGVTYTGIPGFYATGTIPSPSPDPEQTAAALLASGQVAAYCAANPGDLVTCGYPSSGSPIAGVPQPVAIPVSVQASASAPVAVQTTANLQNTSRPGQSFQVGDNWSLLVTGAANSPVTDTAMQNGIAMGTTPYGSTDANGNFSLTGQMGTSVVGSWSETWSVGGVAAPTLTFSVAAAPTAAPAGSQPSGSSGNSGNTSGNTSGNNAAPSCFSLVSGFGIPDPCIGSFPIGVTTIAATAAALILLSSLLGGRR